MGAAERNGDGDGDRAVSATSRVVGVLDTFLRGQTEALTLSELARRAGLPKTTAHRLVGELVRHGLLERTGGRLTLGLRLFELGQLVARQRTLAEAARPVMTDLREATRQTVNLGILEGSEVVYVEILHGPDAPRLPTRVGGRWPAHAAGVGKAILAFCDRATVHAVLDAGLPRLSERTVTAPGLLLRELDRVRGSGVAYDHEEAVPGVVCVASPIMDARQRVCGALSISGWSSKINVDQVVPAVRTAALTVSRTLGAR